MTRDDLSEPSFWRGVLIGVLLSAGVGTLAYTTTAPRTEDPHPVIVAECEENTGCPLCVCWPWWETP